MKEKEKKDQGKRNERLEENPGERGRHEEYGTKEKYEGNTGKHEGKSGKTDFQQIIKQK